MTRVEAGLQCSVQGTGIRTEVLLDEADGTKQGAVVLCLSRQLHLSFRSHRLIEQQSDSSAEPAFASRLLMEIALQGASFG